AEAKKMLVAKDGEPTWSVANAFFGSSAADGKTAFLFPGQGSQYTGMGRDLVCTFPEARRAIAEADHISNKGRLSDYIYPVPAFEERQRSEQAAALTRTDIAQPAIGAVSVAMLRVLERFNVKPDAVAGHSYGELVALRAAGRIDDDTLRHLSEVRGRLMAEGTGDRGTMTAVQAPLDQIERMLTEEKIDVVLAHRNSPTQGILSGLRDAIERATRACASRGWHTTPLNVSGAFHTELMAGAAQRFREVLNDVSISQGSTTVYANRTAEAYPNDADQARALLAGQLVNPVNFAKQIENLYAAGVRVFVEVGPKAVLTGLVYGILGDRSYEAMALDAGCGRRCQVADLARVLARLAAWGRPVALSKWEPDCPEPVKPKMVIPLTGVNYRSAGRNRSDAEAPRIAIPGLGTESTIEIAKSDESINTTQVNSVLQVVQEGLRAMQALQQQTAAAHQRFLETQEQAQKTFQMVMEGQQRLVERTLGLAPAVPSELERSTPQQSASAAAGDPLSQGIAVVQSSTPPAESPHPAAEIVGSEHEIEQALIEVVAETTGYPSESISLEMELEEDLGIDRVRRVDVLSRLGQRVRTARPLNGTQVDRLRTLRDIVAYTVSGSMPDEPASPTPEDASVTETEPAAATDGPVETNDLEKTLLDVVARLTGYPLEMLDPDMDLEADLGIDSIKRVEILAEVQSRIPAMETVDSSYIGSLRTLRNIVEYMKSPAADVSEPRPSGSACCVGTTEPACAPAEGEPGDTLANDARLERRVLRAVTLQKLARRGEIAIAAGREIWIVDDRTALPRALNDRFKALNIRSRVVAPLVEVGGNGDAPIGGLVYLARPRTQDQAVWREEAEDDLKVAFTQAQRVCSMLGDAAAAGGALFATVSRMDGAFGLMGGSYEPVQGGLAGLTKTFAHEWPDVRCKALDVAGAWSDVDAIAEAVIAELGSQGPIEVGLDGEARRGVDSVISEVGEGRLELDPGDVVVVSGGARGVTAEAAHALALACRPTLVLLGRSPAPEPEPNWLAGLSEEAKIKRALLEHAFAGDEKPSLARLESAYRKRLANREVAANIERLERAGARVLYRSIDLRDGAAVREVMERVRQEAGPVRALIHGAGVIDDGLITDKTMERFERVFDTKVAGLRHLLESVEADALKYLVLFTSVSGRFGRQGQVDYAMANEVLNKVAQRYKATQPSWHV
ncbi:MAG: SDR family NAD(P)-dependent oxidoreductase, partial [Phycisphaerae bacterium]